MSEGDSDTITGTIEQESAEDTDSPGCYRRDESYYIHTITFLVSRANLLCHSMSNTTAAAHRLKTLYLRFLAPGLKGAKEVILRSLTLQTTATRNH